MDDQEERESLRREDPLMRTAEFAAVTSTETTTVRVVRVEPKPLPFRKGVAWVALGGAVGAVLRYALSVILPTTTTLTLVDLPWGTLAANLLGCLILGVLTGYWDERPPKFAQCRLVLGTGFCGGFTTMSTFTGEVAAIIGAGFPLEALKYVTVSVLVCVLAVMVGLVAGNRIGIMSNRDHAEEGEDAS